MKLENRGGSPSKFWEPKLAGSKLVVHFGRIGTAGQTRETTFASPAAAKAGLAKLVAEKTRKGYKSAGKAKPAGKAVPTAPKASKHRDAILALAAQLGGKRSKDVARWAVLALDDPHKFFTTTKLELFEDWDDEEIEEVEALPWLALIEMLDEVGRLKEIDWKEAGSETLAGLERIGGLPARKALRVAHNAETQLDQRPTVETLALFGKLLGATGQALIQLDKPSDSYALMIVPPGELPGLAKLARAAGGAIIHWTGKELPKYEADRKRTLARDTTKNPWRMLVVERQHKQTSSAVATVLWDLLHDDDGSLREQIRAAVEFAPERDRPLIKMALALNDGGAPRIAKTTRDPMLCLRALTYLRSEPRERLTAAAVLAARLKVKPDGGELNRLIGDALNLWDDANAVDAALSKLSAAERDNLARLANGLLPKQGLTRIGDALRALESVGDATSLPALMAIDARARARAEARAKQHSDWSADPWSDDEDLPGTLKRINARLRRRR